MKKTIRLSESDLIRLVKRVIKEQGMENEYSRENNECADLFSKMHRVYKFYEKYIDENFSNSDDQEALEIYDDFQSEASELLLDAEELGCEEMEDLYQDYDDYSYTIKDMLGLEDNDNPNLTWGNASM
jgi:hypothetical protein